MSSGEILVLKYHVEGESVVPFYLVQGVGGFGGFGEGQDYHRFRLNMVTYLTGGSGRGQDQGCVIF